MKTFPKPCAVKGFDPSPKHVKNPCRLLGFGPVNTTHGPRRCRWQARCFVRPKPSPLSPEAAAWGITAPCKQAHAIRGVRFTGPTIWCVLRGLSRQRWDNFGSSLAPMAYCTKYCLAPNSLVGHDSHGGGLYVRPNPSRAGNRVWVLTCVT